MSDHDQTQPIGARASIGPTSVLDRAPEVSAFVAAVRRRLVDLTEEEREELIGGLDADISDLVAERGLDALPDVAGYAAELRVAAGFSAEGAAPREPRGAAVMAWLDRGSATWTRWVAAKDHLGLPAFAQSLRPAWWVVRALCATALLAEIAGSQAVYGLTLNRLGVGVIATVVSVQIGRGAWWPGTQLRRSLDLRLTVTALNVLAVILVPVMFNRFLGPVDTASVEGVPVFSKTLSLGEQPVRNIYAYDAQGHPLVGVQLVDQDGRRLAVKPRVEDAYQEQILTPWLNGRSRLYSVFPMPEQSTDPEKGTPVGEARLQTPPFASLPPVTLDGVQPSVLAPPAGQQGRTEKQQQKKRQQQKGSTARATPRADLDGG